MLVRAQSFAVLEHGFGCIAVVDAVYQAAPGAQHRLEHIWITELFARLERGFCTKAEARAWSGNARSCKRKHLSRLCPRRLR